MYKNPSMISSSMPKAPNLMIRSILLLGKNILKMGEKKKITTSNPLSHHNHYYHFGITLI